MYYWHFFVVAMLRFACGTFGNKEIKYKIGKAQINDAIIAFNNKLNELFDINIILLYLQFCLGWIHHLDGVLISYFDLEFAGLCLNMQCCVLV